MSRAAFALLFTLILGPALSGCGSLHLEAGFSQPGELTATAEAEAALAALSPTNTPHVAMPTASPTTAVTLSVGPSGSPVPTTAPTSTARPAAPPVPTTAPSHTPVPAPSPAPSSTPAPPWQVRQPVLHYDSLRSVAWLADGEVLAVTDPQGVHLINGQTLQESFVFESSDSLQDVAWLAGGERLALVDPEGVVHLVNRQTLQEEHVLESGAGVTRVAYSRDGRLLATGTVSLQVQLWDGEGRQLLWTLDLSWQGNPSLASKAYNPRSISSLAFSPDGAMLAARIDGYYGGGDGSVWLWRTDTGEQLAIWGVYGALGVSPKVEFSPDGTILAAPDGWQTSARGSNDIKLWDTRTSRPLSFAPHRPMFDVAFHPGGRLIAGAGRPPDAVGDYVDASRFGVYVWDVGTCEARQVLGQLDSARCVAYSPDGRLIAVGYGEGEIRVWDGDSGELLRTLMGHGAEVMGVAFNPDGRTLASWSGDGSICLWDLP